MENKADLSGKFAVITGATSGIGLAAALEFCRCGATVIGVGRDPSRCAFARTKIIQGVPSAQIQFVVTDLSKQREVRILAAEVKQKLQTLNAPGLDILVNNAGVFSDKFTLTEDGIETTIAVNHLAPFLLTNLLLPLLSIRPESRVITVSSDSHYHTWLNPARLRKPLIYNNLWAYKVSKLANVLFSVELNARQQGRAPHAFAVDPGLVNTDIGLKGTGFLSRFIWRQRQKAGVDPSIPASTILFVAASPDALKSDEIYWYLSAPKRLSHSAINPILANNLWEESSVLCQLGETINKDKP